MIALLDNTVLLNFALVNQAELIREALGTTAATVREVFGGHLEGIRLDRIPEYDWSWLQIFDLTDSERQTFEELCISLGAGEAACIAMAIERQYRVLTDDRAGRKIALQKKCAVSGTLGILVRLVDLERLTLSQADKILEQMVAGGYRSPVSSLSELIQ